ncbi:MAG: zinc ribbon domain-containing protein [Eubacterium sp.]|nr:zinc ribbon domain-containing protein [Eubacterium sp.]
MFCWKCGKELQEGTRFCSKCGSRVQEENENVDGAVNPADRDSSGEAYEVTYEEREANAENASVASL